MYEYEQCGRAICIFNAFLGSQADTCTYSGLLDQNLARYIDAESSIRLQGQVRAYTMVNAHHLNNTDSLTSTSSR